MHYLFSISFKRNPIKFCSNDEDFVAVVYVTGPAKTGHICTKYTCSENSTFLGLCV